MNARVGYNIMMGHGSTGAYGAERMRNRNGERKLKFCVDNQLLIINTFFPHKWIHEVTLVSKERK